MESNYKSRYSGEQVDAAVEYFLNHSQIAQDNSYSYTKSIFCESTVPPSSPFVGLPATVPSFPMTSSTDYKLWWENPNNSSTDWWQCVITIDKSSNKVIHQSAILPMSGERGDTGEAGEAGRNANYHEYRYKRSEAWAVQLTEAQKTSRNPEGWGKTPEGVLYTENELIELGDNAFEKFISKVTGTTPQQGNQWLAWGFETYEDIDSAYQEYKGKSISATQSQKDLIVQAYFEFHDQILGGGSLEQQNQSYHTLYTRYVDPAHQWNLFMITAVIDGDTEELVGEWSQPVKLTGNDGSMGPEGTPGISGVPGVSIGMAFTIGDESRYQAVDPTDEYYSENYSTLFTDGTEWFKSPEECVMTEQFPYIWFTQCRYYKDRDSLETEVMEDPWSEPRRYTGLNGITKTMEVRQPVIYPDGVYDYNKTYINDGTTTPYVLDDGFYYFLALQGTWTGSINDTSMDGLQAYSVNSNPDPSHPWVKFERFEALFANIGIIANGLVGSAVFNGNFMFSQRGVKNGINGTQDTQTPNSSHYEGFLINKRTGMRMADNEVTSNDNSFVPYFWINLVTGEFGSNSMTNAISQSQSSQWVQTLQYLQSNYSTSSQVDEMLYQTSSQILQTASEISLQVKEELGGEMKAAGIDISSGRVKVTGEFEGTMGGTFNGNVAATSLSVLGKDGLEAMRLDTYDPDTMGTPAGDYQIDPGTPVIIVNFQGTQYVLSAVRLNHNSGTSQGIIVEPVWEPLQIANSISTDTIGVQGSAQYKTLRVAPHLKINNDQGIVSRTVPAYIKIGAQNPVNSPEVWSEYIGKCWPATQAGLQKNTALTSISSEMLVYDLTEPPQSALAKVYLGQPTKHTIGVYLGAFTPANSPTVYVYTPIQISAYQKIAIVNGDLKYLDQYLVVGNRVEVRNGGVYRDPDQYTYYTLVGIDRIAHKMTGSYIYPNSVSSSYFFRESSSPMEVTSDQLKNSAILQAV